MDATSANVEVGNYLAGLTGDVKGLRIAVPKRILEAKVLAKKLVSQC